ncbi:DUF2510 domain-containing protein [Microbacterium sp. NPDC057407]|uniref:DUF2510 domain-containing protein n=1 Tax=Microbacterium sp. NPDC057407 TaxID=3346120 RepID=UPI00366C5E70
MSSIPPGWYPDPAVPATLRYWDGATWTPFQHATVSPFDAPELRAPAGTSWNTVWIWLVVLVPVVPLLLFLFVPWGSMFEIDPALLGDPQAPLAVQALIRQQFAVFGSPLFIASQLLSYGGYGLSVWFSYLDWRELRRRDVPRPFHWAWAFLNPVYPIGRSVVVVRRTGHGWTPLWVTIATLVVSMAVSVAIMLMMFSGMAGMMREVMDTIPS